MTVQKRSLAGLVATVLVCIGCASTLPPPAETVVVADYYGTLEPFASDAVYFLMTDRFVDGDPTNNHPEQGGGAERGTFDRPIQLAGERPANIGYLGGDFKGIVDNAGYIADMGFSALWLTPIADNPDEAFTGGTRPGEGAFAADRGKTGYHGYWGVNFFELDEHLPSQQLDFADFTREMGEHGLKVVLDVVCNHGSPAFTMPEDQPKYGELYDGQGKLVADHQNRHPSDLDPGNPLHAFYNRAPDLAELSDMNADNPDVLDYFVDAYLQWIDQGAAAFRVDTIKHMPHAFWKSFSDRIREQHPGFFMFAESFSYEAKEISQHTYPENGAISVLDFPGQQAMNSVFADGGSYTELLDYLHLDSRLYANSYELMTFYDNHDMPRMNADADGFVDAHNWLFTSRGIPVVYYGSEIGFRAGTNQHAGNRDYFGQENIERARDHRIRYSLSAIAKIRQQSPALQRGLQLNLEFGDDTASFYRVYRRNGDAQTALVLLNKSDESVQVDLSAWLGTSHWRDSSGGAGYSLADGSVSATIDAHGVKVLLLDAVPSLPGFAKRLDDLQRTARR